MAGRIWEELFSRHSRRETPVADTPSCSHSYHCQLNLGCPYFCLFKISQVLFDNWLYQTAIIVRLLSAAPHNTVSLTFNALLEFLNFSKIITDDKLWQTLWGSNKWAALKIKFQFPKLLSKGKARPSRSRMAISSSQMKVGESSCGKSNCAPTFANL